MGFAHEYATAVAWRGRVMMEPVDFVPDWGDKPRRAKFYPDVLSFPLPDTDDPAAASVERGLHGGAGDGAFTLDLLGGMLRDSYGLIGRRLGVQANTDLAALPSYPNANWSRGTASGGGLYPVGIYWTAGPGGPLLPGAYHYSPGHHAMQRLAVGDPSGEVRAAVGDEALTGDTDQFLVLGIKFWQNSFKYNSFSYHAVTMDVGALVQTWRMWAQARGLRIAPIMWFDEERLSRVLGVPTDDEGLFAVVPLRWEGASTHTETQRTEAPRAEAQPPVRVRHADRERSRRVLTFETIRRVHAATTEHAAERPDRSAIAAGDALPPDPARGVVALPEPRPLEASVRRALHSRRSSFGRFSAQRAIAADQLSAILAAAVAGGALECDVTAPGGAAMAKLYAFVSHVEGIAPGSYEYDPAGRSLRLVKPGPPGEFLQRNYFLANYNLEQAAAVLVPTVRTHAVLDAVGDRGIRLVNAVVGAVAEAVYTASAAAGTACGVALGFDTISYIEELDLEAAGEIPLLTMMIGNERPRPADFRHDFAPCGPAPRSTR
jgi:SagB-type dehydrogenase family enzyme